MMTLVHNMHAACGPSGQNAMVADQLDIIQPSAGHKL
jgi:hypothetical protein